MNRFPIRRPQPLLPATALALVAVLVQLPYVTNTGQTLGLGILGIVCAFMTYLALTS